MSGDTSPKLTRIDKHNISQLIQIRVDELTQDSTRSHNPGTQMHTTVSERKLTQEQLRAMEARIAKLKKEQDKADQAIALTVKKEQQLLEARLKQKQELDAKEKWRQEMKRQEQERRQRILEENEEKRRKLDEVRRSLLNDRRVTPRQSLAKNCKAISHRNKQEASYYAKADFIERKKKQTAVVGDFMNLMHSRDQRSSSLKERLKADYQNKMHRERNQTEGMTHRIKQLEQMEASMMEKLRNSQERVQQEKGRYDKLMLNRSVYDPRELSSASADQSL